MTAGYRHLAAMAASRRGSNGMATTVDLIVLGAPHPAQLGLAWWRSVASRVTANAHCSVYVVRVPAD